MLKKDDMFKRLFFRMETRLIDRKKTHCVLVKMDHTKPEKEECIPVEELHDYF